MSTFDSKFEGEDEVLRAIAKYENKAELEKLAWSQIGDMAGNMQDVSELSNQTGASVEDLQQLIGQGGDQGVGSTLDNLGQAGGNLLDTVGDVATLNFGDAIGDAAKGVGNVVESVPVVGDIAHGIGEGIKGLFSAKNCECWEGYKRVPGTKPCAPGSCEKCDTHRDQKDPDSKKSSQGDKPSPEAAQAVHEALANGNEEQALELLERTDCPEGCETHAEGKCNHGYMSAGRTRVRYLIGNKSFEKADSQAKEFGTTDHESEGTSDADDQSDR